MPRITIYLTEKTLAALREYLEREHPGKAATSLVVEMALRNFLLQKDLISPPALKKAGQKGGD